MVHYTLYILQQWFNAISVAIIAFAKEAIKHILLQNEIRSEGSGFNQIISLFTQE